MGLHLPFIGYFKARGKINVRKNRTSHHNRGNEAKIAEFFQITQDAFSRGLEQHTPIWRSNNSNNNIVDAIMFETNDYARPELIRFLEMPRPKTLVITTLGDLFEATVENEVVAAFLAQAAAEPPLFPVLCLDQVDYQLTPNLLNTMDGETFAQRLWGNEMKMREAFARRQHQLHRAA